MRLQVYGDGIIPRHRQHRPPAWRRPTSLMVTAPRQTVARGVGFAATEDGWPPDSDHRPREGRGRPRQRQRQLPRCRRQCRARRKAGRAAFAPVTAEGQTFVSRQPAVQPRHRRGLLRPRPAPEPADELQWRGRRARPAQHGRRRSRSSLSTRNYGVLWDNNSITRFGDPEPYPLRRRRRRRPDASRARTARPAGPRPISSATARSRAAPSRMIDYQYLDDQPQLAGGDATAPNGAGTAPRRPRRLDRQRHAARQRRPQVPALFVQLCQGLRRRPARCSTAGGRTGTPGTTISTSSSTPGKPRRHPRRMGAQSAATSRSTTTIRCPRSTATRSACASEVGTAIDYYFIAGDDMDEVIAGYRRLTGKAPMMPRWAYGFWQSRQRYETQDAAARRARANIAAAASRSTRSCRTGSTGPRTRWGSHDFDPARFPDPAGDGRRGPRAQRPDHDLGLAEILSDHRATIRSSTRSAAILYQRAAREPRQTATGSARATPTPSTIPTSPRRATSTGARSARRSSTGASTPGGSTATSPTCTPTSRSRSAHAQMSPTAAGSGRGDLQFLPAGPCRRRLSTACSADQPDTRPFILTRSRLRRHPARRRRALVGRRRRALGRSARPDLAPGSISRCRACPTGPTTSAASRSRSATRSQDPAHMRRMARALPALVPVRRLLARCSAATASSRAARSTTSPPDGSAMYDGADLLRPAALPAAALHLHHRRRHLASRRHDDARRW